VGSAAASSLRQSEDRHAAVLLEVVVERKSTADATGVEERERDLLTACKAALLREFSPSEVAIIGRPSTSC
jgi:hypothetical protein